MAATYIKSRIAASIYAKRMERLRKRIFGELVRPTHPMNLHISKAFSQMPNEESEHRAIYYPPHPMLLQLSKLLRNHGLFRDEHQDFKEEMDRLRELRGKVPPKIGEGKKAMLKKAGRA